MHRHDPEAAEIYQHIRKRNPTSVAFVPTPYPIGIRDGISLCR